MATKSYICKWIFFAISNFAKIKQNPWKLYRLPYRRPTVQDVPCNCTIGLVVLGMYTKVRWVVEFITRGYIINLNLKKERKKNLCTVVPPTYAIIVSSKNIAYVETRGLFYVVNVVGYFKIA